MIKNRLINSLVVLIAAAPLILGCSAKAWATENKTYVVEKKFETTDKLDDGKKHFLETLETEGKRYILKNIEVVLLEEILVEREKITFDGEAFSGNPESHKPLEVIERDGVTYKLKESTLIEIALEERKKDITTMMPYQGVEYIDSLPELGSVEIIDDDTQQKISTKLPYKSHEEVASYWDDDFTFPVTVASYDAETYQLGDLEIPKGAELILYDKELLQHLGLPTEYYRIQEIDWEGDVYESNGELRRDALAIGQKMLKDIEVTYAGTVTFDAISAQAYNSVYEALPKEGERAEDTLYVIQATATYEQSEAEISESAGENSFWRSLLEWIKNHPVLATICLALMLFVLWFIAFLFLLAKKKREEKKSTEIIIHDEDEKL